MVPQKIIVTLKTFLYLNVMMQNIKIPNKNKSLYLFLIYACSLNKIIDYLQHILSCTNFFFFLFFFFFAKIVISETKITKQLSLLNNLDLNIYFFCIDFHLEFCRRHPLFYCQLSNEECCSDLNVYKNIELESTFIENFNLK